MADGKPTLHHMDNSQSQRILWLLEELEIPYNLELHYRIKSGPRKGTAPPELAELHPMGKAPQLVTAEGRIVAESAAISAYLITTYDTGKRFQGDGWSRNDWVRDESLTSFAGASLGPVTILKLLLDIATLKTPFLLRPLVRWMTGAVDQMYSGPELKKMMTYLEADLGGQDYFMGEAPGRADFMLSYPMDMVAALGWLDFGEYPRLKGWREKCQAREAWKKALGKGNGYDMASMMKDS